jgi:hypothetical protein
MATENNQHPGSIPVELAVEYTTNWRTYLSSSNEAFDLQSIWVSIDKIKSLLEHNAGADGLRVYMGLEDPADATSIKIVMVPTKNEQDVVELEDGRPNVIDQLIYCPPICPVGSPLNG